MGNEVAKKNTEEGNSKIMKKIIRARDKNSKYNKEEVVYVITIYSFQLTFFH